MLAIVSDPLFTVITDHTCEFERVVMCCALFLRKILLGLKSIQNVMGAFVCHTITSCVIWEKRSIIVCVYTPEEELVISGYYICEMGRKSWNIFFFFIFVISIKFYSLFSSNICLRVMKLEFICCLWLCNASHQCELKFLKLFCILCWKFDYTCNCWWEHG